MPEERRAKLFMNGRSQAVRLPKEFRFEGDEVRIRRLGDAVILEPVEKRGWPVGFWEEFDQLPAIAEDFQLPERPNPSDELSNGEQVIEEWIRPPRDERESGDAE